jgi:hypothetical protein
MDLLTDIVRLMRPQTVLWRTVEADGRWGMRVPYRATPRFCLVVVGHCWFVPDEGAPRLLRQGDYFLLAGKTRYCLTSDLDVMPKLDALRRRARNEDYLRWNDAVPGAPMRLIGGHFQTDPEHAELLAALLPQQIDVRASDEEAGRLSRVLELIGEEAVCEQPGRDLVMSRLVEIMLVEVLRRPMLRIEGQRTGWLSGMADPQIALALQRMPKSRGTGPSKRSRNTSACRARCSRGASSNAWAWRRRRICRTGASRSRKMRSSTANARSAISRCPSAICRTARSARLSRASSASRPRRIARRTRDGRRRTREPSSDPLEPSFFRICHAACARLIFCSRKTNRRAERTC